jgi:hypothetical protein
VKIYVFFLEFARKYWIENVWQKYTVVVFLVSETVKRGAVSRITHRHRCKRHENGMDAFIKLKEQSRLTNQALVN